MARKFKAQIVVMCKEDMAKYVREQAKDHEETIAGMSRIMLAESKRVRDVAAATGYSVEDILRQVEAYRDAALSPR